MRAQSTMCIMWTLTSGWTSGSRATALTSRTPPAFSCRAATATAATYVPTGVYICISLSVCFSQYVYVPGSFSLWRRRACCAEHGTDHADIACC
jgi:hypothetical protein